MGRGYHKEEDLKDVEKLCSMLTTLPIKYRKHLRANLAVKRLYNTTARKHNESTAAYLYRRAQRDADDDALIEMSNKLDEKEATKEKKLTEGKKKTKKTKKKGAAKKSFEEQRETELALDKDGGETYTENSPAFDETLKASTNTKPNFKAEFAQIDGPGGVIEAATQDDSNDNDAIPEWKADVDSAESVRDR